LGSIQSTSWRELVNSCHALCSSNRLHVQRGVSNRRNAATMDRTTSLRPLRRRLPSLQAPLAHQRQLVPAECPTGRMGRRAGLSVYHPDYHGHFGGRRRNRDAVHERKCFCVVCGRAGTAGDVRGRNPSFTVDSEGKINGALLVMWCSAARVPLISLQNGDDLTSPIR
jgi:hypothetical protein